MLRYCCGRAGKGFADGGTKILGIVIGGFVLEVNISHQCGLIQWNVVRSLLDFDLRYDLVNLG